MVKGRLAKVALLFSNEFYRFVPPDDIADSDPRELAAIAVSMLEFGRVRDPDALLIRAFNPTVAVNGWASQHSVVEIINDDMSFLVDSAVNELARQGISVSRIIHPVFKVRRTREGAISRLHSTSSNDTLAISESFIHIELNQQGDEEVLQRVVDRLTSVLGHVRSAVEDWPQMRARVAGVLAELDADPPPIRPGGLSESKHFLRWLDDGHFTFLGCRDYRLVRRKGAMRPEIVSGSGLGILRGDGETIFDSLRSGTPLPPEVAEFINQPRLLLIGKAPKKSPVHRNVYMDRIGVKQYNRRGEVIGEKLFLGLFTASAYNRSPAYIPLLRRKISQTIKAAGLQPNSHNGKALLHILETFPRDELFQIPHRELMVIAGDIVHLQERHRTTLFLWGDPFERFVSCLVYLPSDRHSTDLRKKIQRILEQAFGGECRLYDTELDLHSVLTRLHFVIGTEPGKIPPYDAQKLEARIVAAVRSWSDQFQETLLEAKGELAGGQLATRYANAFSVGYQDRYSANSAVIDVEKIEALQPGQLGMHLYRPKSFAEHEVRFKIYSVGGAVTLSDVMPVLENLGLKTIDERPYRVRPRDRDVVWMHDFTLVHRDRLAIHLEDVEDTFQDAFARVWAEDMENDGFNRLVLNAGLSWRQVVVLRAYCKFLRQVQIPFSQDYMQDTLARNRDLARLIIELFETRFDPGVGAHSEEKANAIRVAITTGLDDVASLDEDRIICRFVNLVESTLRTNFFQQAPDGSRRPSVSFKFDSPRIEELPLPHPKVEIFVYSPRVEGVHMRFGKVARGGLRWSDRREDFRTEVLGLVKAQQVKNSIIVPVGSKGGFVVKRPPADGSRDELQQEGIACYQTFISGMLDLTDNLVGDQIIPPSNVVRKDDDDVYLVVAADKGTATFSDIANVLAEDYGFWLGDAFASGGSAGYDHKKMGITARGAWESVKRHFRELGKNIEREEISVVGVGDMSGDVFGNGMLLSKHIQLIGAFNHLHIFVDPNPDPERSWEERHRLFQLARSSWSDYDRRVLSEGGDVFSRSAKSITVSPAMKKRLGANKSKMTPNELIRKLLLAQVDLLWFGGIGSYVKSRSESHADVGDRSNDAVRMDGRQVAARVVGEGANLGMTQLGRVEYALTGGRINTDAVDNSAGVDCSDHEVNIKVLLRAVEQEGKLTRRQRDNLLQKMTDEVAELVIRDNYLQTGCLSVSEEVSSRLTDRLANFMRELERAGHLNRAIEFLPDDETLAERKARELGFSRPELCTLTAYAKIVLYEELLDSTFPDSPSMSYDLEHYFPTPLRQKYKHGIGSHRLRREIIATMATNAMVNRVGIVFANEIKRKTGVKACDVARAFAIVRNIFDMRDLWQQIDSLDNIVAASIQSQMHAETGRLVERVTTWFIMNCDQPLDITQNIETYGPGVREAISILDEMITPNDRAYLQQRAAIYSDAGTPEALARRVANLRLLVSACDIVKAARAVNASVERAGLVYFSIGSRLNIDWLRRQAAGLTTESHWENQAVTAIVDDLYGHQYQLTVKMLQHANGNDEDESALIGRWCKRRGPGCVATTQVIHEIHSTGGADLAMLTVANRQLRSLASE